MGLAHESSERPRHRAPRHVERVVKGDQWSARAPPRERARVSHSHQAHRQETAHVRRPRPDYTLDWDEPVNAEIQHTRQIEQGAIAKFRQFYFGIGGPEFYPVDYLNGYAITQVATLIAQHRADSVGEALRFLLQQEEAQGQYRQAQAAADRRHRQNLQHRQDVANRAILWDMWRDWP